MSGRDVGNGRDDAMTRELANRIASNETYLSETEPFADKPSFAAGRAAAAWDLDHDRVVLDVLLAREK